MMEALQGLENLSQSQIADNSRKLNEALTRKNSDLRPALQFRVPLTLDTAADQYNPFKVAGPFSGFYVETDGTTDSSTKVKMSLSSRDAANMRNYTVTKFGDSGEFNEPVNEVLLTWDSQPGKILTLIFYLGLSFKPGSSIVQLTGGVALNFGTGMTPDACQSIGAAAVKQILPANSARKKATISVLSGDTLYLSGTSAVKSATGLVAGTTLVGIPTPVGSTYEWENTGAIWGYSDAGCIIAIQEES